MTDVIGRIEGQAGRMTLNRPQALNALTLDMADAMTAQLDAWAGEPAVKLVILDAAGGKAFCAGGDIQALYDAMTSGNLEPAQRFFTHEYRLDRLIAKYPKPVVALMHGIVIGGGVGISAHASHRIVTDRTLFVLPECSIGLIPDVGTTHLLARAPGRLGEYIGLTGSRLAAADCLTAGLADTYVSSERLGELVAALTATGDVAAIPPFASAAPASGLAAKTASISAVFDAATAVEIAARLGCSKAEWAPAALTAMRAAAPLSVHSALWAIRQARTEGTLEAALANEYRFAMRALTHGDFQEGIRAAVIDKDRKPVWRDNGLDAVASGEVAAMFAPLGAGELNHNRSA